MDPITLMLGFAAGVVFLKICQYFAHVPETPAMAYPDCGLEIKDVRPDAVSGAALYAPGGVVPMSERAFQAYMKVKTAPRFAEGDCQRTK